MGIRATTSANSYWCTFDNFRLYFYGSMTKDIIDGIDEAIVDKSNVHGLPLFPADVYTLSGVLVRKAAESLDNLAKGVYIVNGRKILVP